MNSFPNLLHSKSVSDHQIFMMILMMPNLSLLALYRISIVLDLYFIFCQILVNRLKRNLVTCFESWNRFTHTHKWQFWLPLVYAYFRRKSWSCLIFCLFFGEFWFHILIVACSAKVAAAKYFDRNFIFIIFILFWWTFFHTNINRCDLLPVLISFSKQKPKQV